MVKQNSRGVIHVRTRLVFRSLLSILIVLMMFSVMVLPQGICASAEVKNFSVTPTKSAYYIGETPQILVKFDYYGFANNTSLKIEIYNSSNDLVLTITSITILSDTYASNLNGTYEATHSLTSDFAKEQGSKTYSAKLIDVATGYKLAEATFTINVQTESIMILVSWLDASQDRKIEPQEQVTFSVFIQWSFVNESKTVTLYVKVDSSSEIVVTTVNITLGSGQASTQWATSFAVKGTHTVRFELRDVNNELLASQSLQVTVGEIEEEKQSIWDIVNANLQYIVIAVLLVIVILLVVKEKRD